MNSVECSHCSLGSAIDTSTSIPSPTGNVANVDDVASTRFSFLLHNSHDCQEGSWRKDRLYLSQTCRECPRAQYPVAERHPSGYLRFSPERLCLELGRQIGHETNIPYV